jgi:hypothetical protein
MTEIAKSRSIRLAIALVIIIAALVVAAYLVFVWMPARVARNTKEVAVEGVRELGEFGRALAEDVDKIVNFRPKVTTGGVTVVEASREIAELSTIEKTFEHTYTYESTWLGSTKRIKITGTFVAKAGYDLTKPFAIDVSADRMTIRATLPPAQLNSIEQTKITAMDDEDGWWNRISAEERAAAANSLLRDAKQSIQTTRLLEEADAALLNQIEKAVRKSAPEKSKIIREPLG